MATSNPNLPASPEQDGILAEQAVENTPKYRKTLIRERQERCAHNLTMGMGMRQAMLDAGYSEAVANKGVAGIPKKVLRIMGRGSKNMLALGDITAQDQEKLVRGRLVYNTIRGQDKGVMSAYRLGQDRRVNMFVAESQTGIMVIQAPIREIGLEKPSEELPTASAENQTKTSPKLDNK